jgi:hypothetical protein
MKRRGNFTIRIVKNRKGIGRFILKIRDKRDEIQVKNQRGSRRRL